MQRRSFSAKPRLFTSHPPHGCTPQRAPRGEREKGEGGGGCAQAVAAGEQAGQPDEGQAVSVVQYRPSQTRRTAPGFTGQAGRAQEHSQRPRTKASSFHRLLLRFDQLRRGFEKCHALFREIDTDRNGVIDLRVLPCCLPPLGCDRIRAVTCKTCLLSSRLFAGLSKPRAPSAWMLALSQAQRRGASLYCQRRSCARASLAAASISATHCCCPHSTQLTWTATTPSTSRCGPGCSAACARLQAAVS